MKLQKIEIEQFGGLKDFVLELSDGAHYICGENEAGKSTLCAFIAIMFYGFLPKYKKDGLRGDGRSLYMPWGETYMAGTLHFEADGVDYVLKRRFGKTNKGDKTTLMTASDWQEVSIAPNEIGQHFLGIRESEFYKTLFIGQLGAVFVKDKDDELITRLSNLETTGDEDAPLKKALSELEHAQYDLITKSGRSGTIVQLDSEIEALKTELLEAKQRHLSFQSLLADIQRMTAEKEAAEEKLAALLAKRKEANAFLEYQQYKNAVKKQEELSEKLKKEQEALAGLYADKESLLLQKNAAESVLALEQDIVLKLAEKEAACGVVEQQLAEQEALLREVDELQNKLGEIKPNKVSVPLVAAMLFFVILTVILGVFVSHFFYILTAVFALGVFLGFRRGENKEQLALSAMLTEKQGALARMQEAGIEEKLIAIKGEIQAVFQKVQVGSLPELTAKIESAKALAYKLDSTEKEAVRLCAAIQALEQELAAMPPLTEKPAVEYIGPEPETIDEMYRTLQNKQVEREMELAQKQAKVENGFLGTRSVSLIESDIEEALGRRRQLYETYEAISLAQSVMAECAEELKNTFAPVLNEKSGALIAELTNGRYQEVRVTDECKIMLKTPDGNDIVPAEFVSAGTYDLLYFALRMAVLQTLYDEIPILILDDTFMQLDDARQKEAFSWLCQKHAGQVLYFSCHKPPEGWTEAVITL
ncbi:MAG: hypothetical protein E7400_06330 [Ruminococcaceae bacterium]|nr:hypothetical protein [Oscillospiraceae bacterium]